MSRTRFLKDFQTAITQKLRKRVQSFLCMTLCLDLIYISIKYHEDFFVYRLTTDRRTNGGTAHAKIRPFLFKRVYKNEHNDKSSKEQCTQCKIFQNSKVDDSACINGYAPDLKCFQRHRL